MTWLGRRLRHVLASLVHAQEAFEEGDVDETCATLRSLELDVAELLAEADRQDAT